MVCICSANLWSSRAEAVTASDLTVKILSVFGQHNYGEPARGASYEYSNFIPALRNLGHEVIHFESWNRSKHRSFADLNQAFLETVERVKPDVIFCVSMHYELWLEVLEAVRVRCPATLVHWGTDDSWKYEQSSRWVAPAFHLHATTVPEAVEKARHDGLTNFFLSQWAASSVSLAEPQPAAKCRYPVTFIGSAYGNRRRWIAELKKRGIEVECFGYGWPNGPVKAEEIPHILRHSVLSLNFGDSGLHLGRYGLYRSRQIKARVFEVPGAGGCLVTESAPYLANYYVSEREIVTFKGLDDLVQRTSYLLSHPEERDAIARAGHERTVREHTYELRFGRLLEVAIQKQVASTSHNDRRCDFDEQWFIGLRRKHEIGGFLRVIRWCVVWAFSVLLGLRRGPRAARRLIYELSWRLSGRRTFTSTGLPGRMFYQES